MNISFNRNIKIVGAYLFMGNAVYTLVSRIYANETDLFANECHSLIWFICGKAYKHFVCYLMRNWIDLYMFDCNYNNVFNAPSGSLAQWVECLLMVRETWVPSQFASYQRLLKWYLIPPCLALSIIRYVSRVKWSNPGKGVAPSPTNDVVAIEKEAFWSPSTTVANFIFNWIICLLSYMISSISIQFTHSFKCLN